MIMVKKVKEFGRFYSLFRKMDNPDEDLKCELVGTFTGGRTTSLREMSAAEYKCMCDRMDPDAAFQTKIKGLRHAVLNLLQKLGVDTTDFAHVDNYCLSPRIAGKVFRALSVEELKALVRKLKKIEGKGTKAGMHESAKAGKCEGSKDFRDGRDFRDGKVFKEDVVVDHRVVIALIDGVFKLEVRN
jgi:hypothetical protein